MAVPACFHLADSVFPRVRAEAARRLVAAGWSQSKAADHLGVSQAMVSKYAAATGPESDAIVLRLVDELLDEDGTPDGWCAVLNPGKSNPGSESALQDLLQAERRLLEASPTQLMPQLGINIAVALPDASGPHDVLAYPARIVDAGGGFIRPVAPAFGASRHLAACLIGARRDRPHIASIANVRGGADIPAALPIDAVATIEGPGDRTIMVPQACSTLDPATRTLFIHDAGGMGIEPCLYVLGDRATTVVATILDLSQRIPEQP